MHKDHPELSSGITILIVELANVCAAMDTLTDQDAYRPATTIFESQSGVSSALSGRAMTAIV